MLKKIQRIISTLFKQEYAKASIYYVFANIMGQGIVLLSSAVFTRMMSKVEYGLVSTYSTWVLVLNTFICMNIFISVRTAYIDYKDDYDDFVSSVLLLNILLGILTTTLIIGVDSIFNMRFGTVEVLFACIQSVALNIINYYLAVQGMKNNYKQRTAIMIAPNWVHTILSVALIIVFFNNKYLAKIAGNAFGLLLFGIICAFLLFRVAKPHFRWDYWTYSVKISFPSIFHTLSDLILMQCDRLMLTSMVGADETAEYSVVYNVSSIIVAIYQAINGAWLPWMFKKLNIQESEKIKKYQKYYVTMFLLFSCFMMSISPELIKIISPCEYWKGIRYVGPIVVASYLIFLFAFFSSYLLYLKRTGIIALNTIVAAVLNFVLNFYLIPKYKAPGAVCATVVSYLVLFCLHLAAVYKARNEFIELKSMLLSIVAITVYAIVFHYILDMIVLRYVIIAVALATFYLFKGRKLIKLYFDK